MEAIGTSPAALHHNEEQPLLNQKVILGSKSLQSDATKNVDASNTKLVEEDTLEKNIHDD